VTMEWDDHCACGRTGPRLARGVERLASSDADKVSCAATPEAHDATVSLLRSVGR